MMNREQARSILASEGLERFSWFADRPPFEMEVGIRRGASGYVVYVTDERAAPVYTETFVDESVALEELLRRTRSLNTLILALQARKGRA